MKTWKIKIKATDEASAVVYLDMLRTTFKSSVILREDMLSFVGEDTDKKEKVVCKMTHT